MVLRAIRVAQRGTHGDSHHRIMIMRTSEEDMAIMVMAAKQYVAY